MKKKLFTGICAVLLLAPLSTMKAQYPDVPKDLKASADKITARKMWLGVTALFLFLLAGWTAAVVASHRAHIAEIPVPPQPGKP